MKPNTSALFVLSAAFLTASSFAQAPATIITPAPALAKSDVGVSSKDGITLSGAEVFVTRNGATEKLAKELELPNGIRVQPDGTILTRDGGKLTLRATQVLTFEGELVNAPIRESAAPNTTTTTTVTTGAAAAPSIPTIVVEKPALTKEAAEEAARIEAERRANSANKGAIKAGEGVQK